MSLPILRWDSGFNPRTPCGVRRLCLSDNDICEIVSIHALLAECDDLAIITILQDKRFNPRTPCGVRQAPRKKAPEQIMFQSTHSLRSATVFGDDAKRVREVSIHALLAECDVTVTSLLVKFLSFNPRTPCGVRPISSPVICSKTMFQSTHSLRSATYLSSRVDLQEKVSIHALLAECDIKLL